MTKSLQRHLAVFVVFLLLWTVFLPTVVVLAEAAVAAPQTANQNAAPVAVRYTASARHTPQGNGAVLAEIFTAPMFQQDSDGRWRLGTRGFGVPKRTEFGWSAQRGSFTAHLADMTGAPRTARLEAGEHWVEWSMAGAGKIRGVFRESGVVYPGAWAGVDLRYSTTATGLKEELVITDDGAPHVYRFALDSDLTAEPMDGGLVLRDSVGEAIFTIPQPYAYDGAGQVSLAVIVPLAGNRFEVRVDELWLRHPDRVFPIVIDPTVNLRPDGATGMDTWISSAALTLNYGGDGELRVGNSGSGINRALLKFDLSSIPRGATITTATLALTRTNVSGTGTLQDYELRSVTKPWLETEATWNKATSRINWTAAGGDFDTAIGGLIDGYKNLNTGTAGAGTVTWNVKASVEQALGTGSNPGYLLKSRYEDAAALREIRFASSDGMNADAVPKLTVEYQEDATPPAVSITANPTLSGTATVSASATDSGAGVDRVEFLVDGGLVGTDTSAPYEASIDTTKYPDGSHVLDAVAYDRAGNVGRATKLVLLSDGFNDATLVDSRDTTVKVQDGMVSLVDNSTPVAVGPPVVSATKAAEAHGLDKLQDASESTYWKSAGMTSADGIESIVLDFGGGYSIHHIQVTALRPQDGLKARYELLDSQGQPLPGTAAPWVSLYGSGTSPTGIGLYNPEQSAAKARISFSNLAPDVLTGLYHAEIAEVQVTYSDTYTYPITTWDPVVDHYDIYTATATDTKTASCEHYSTESCNGSVTYSPSYGAETKTGSVSCSSCSSYATESPTQKTYTYTLSGGSVTSSGSSPASAAGSVSCPTVGCKEQWSSVSWPSYSDGTGSSYWSPAYAGLSSSDGNRKTDFGGLVSLGRSSTFYWGAHWTKQMASASQSQTYTRTRYEAAATLYPRTTYGTGTDYSTVSYTPSGSSFAESNAAANATDGSRSTSWLGGAATPANGRSDTATMELPFTAAASVNSVYVDPQFDGMSATIKLLDGAGATLATLPVSDLRRGLYRFSPAQLASKVRVELSNLQGPGPAYYAGIRELKASDSTVAMTGTLVSSGRAVGSAPTLTLYVRDATPAGTSISYALRFDSLPDQPVTPGVAVTVPQGALNVKLVATLTGDGVQTPSLYQWTLSAPGSGCAVTFQNGAAAAPTPGTPMLSFTAPAALSTVGDSATVTVTSSRADTSKVEFYVDGALMFTKTGTPFTWTWNTAGLPSGAHVIKALAYDAGTQLQGGSTRLVSTAAGSPPSFQATAQSGSADVSTSWGAVAGAGSYKLYRSANNFSTVDKTWTVSGLSFTDSDAKTAGAAYAYRVTAVDSATGSEGRPSITQSVTIGSPDPGESRVGLERFYPYASLPLGGTVGYLNLTNGNLAGVATDVAQVGPGLVMAVRRTYNSLDLAGGSNTQRWRWNHQITSAIDPATKTVTLTNADGAVNVFPYANGAYGRPAGVYIWVSESGGVVTATHRNGVTWTFDTAGRLAQLADRNGNRITYTYSPDGKLNLAEDNVGHRFTYGWTGSLLTSVTYGPAGATIQVSYEYDAAGDLVKVTDPANNFWLYAYDANHRLIGAVTPTGNLWSVLYDGAGRVSSATDPLGNATRISYSQAATPPATVVTDPRNNPVTFNYNSTGQMTKQSQTVSNYDGTSTTIAAEFAYDADFNLLIYTDPRGQVWSGQYDDRGNLRTQTQPSAQTGGEAASTLYFREDSQNPDLPTFIVEPGGVWTFLEYDAAGNLLRSTRTSQDGPASAKQVFTYLPNGLRDTARSEWGGLTDYDYDSRGRLVAVTDPLGNVTQTSYDDFDQPLTMTDPAGNTTRYRYDELGRLVQTTYADGTNAQITYTPDGQVVSVRDNNGNRTSYVYDAAGRPVSSTGPVGTTTSSYDAAGNQIRVVNPNGWATTTTYDEANRMKSTSVSVTSPAAATYTQSYKYDAAGQLVRAKNPNNNEVALTYDNLGREVASQVAPGTAAAGTWTKEYDLRGRLQATVDPNWHRLSYRYDAFDRLVEVRENLLGGVQHAVETTNTTTINQNFTAVSASMAPDTSQFYNGGTSLRISTSNLQAGEGVRIAVPGLVAKGQTISAQIAARGSGTVTVQLRDPKNGNKVAQTSMALTSAWALSVPVDLALTGAADVDSNQVVLEVLTAAKSATTFYLDALTVNQTTKTAYSDFVDQQATANSTHAVTSTDALGRSAVTTLDLIGRTVATTNPLNQVTRITYSDATNSWTLVDPLGRSTVQRYNSRNWLSSIQYTDGSTVAYSYDGNGNRLAMQDSLGTTSYSYDGANRLTRKVDPYGQVIGYTYNGAVLREVNLPTGRITYNYNEAGFPTSMVVTDPTSATETTSFAWDGVGQLKSQTSIPAGQGGPGFVTNWTYDQAERLTQVVGTYNGGTRYSQTYQYDASGTATQDSLYNSYDGTTLTRTYSYDPLYRLILASDSDGRSRSYTYDGVGNRRTRQEKLNGTLKLDEEYTFDAANHLLSLTATDYNQSPSQSSTVTYEWDANGNQTRVTDSKKGVTAYAYDYANRLIGAQFGNGSRVSYGYDGDGVRLWANESQTVRYVVDTGQVVAELDGAGAVIASTWRAAGGNPVSSHQREGTYYFQLDRLGSVVGLAKPDGNWDSVYKYDEYGQVTSNKGSAWNTFKYTGAMYSESLGLYHLQARDYSPVIGRFITQDTYKGSAWKPWTQNLYTYVGNNPVNYIDPTGHNCRTPDGGYDNTCPPPESEQTSGASPSSPNPEAKASAGETVAAAATLVATAVTEKDPLKKTAAWAVLVTIGTVIAKATTTTVADTLTPKPRRILYHYTTKEGAAAIMVSGVINPSLLANNPKDARYGDGVYFTDIMPGSMTQGQISRALWGVPYMTKHTEAYIMVDVTNLMIEQTSKPHILLYRTQTPLNIRHTGYPGITPQ